MFENKIVSILVINHLMCNYCLWFFDFNRLTEMEIFYKGKLNEERLVFLKLVSCVFNRMILTAGIIFNVSFQV